MLYRIIFLIFLERPSLYKLHDEKNIRYDTCNEDKGWSECNLRHRHIISDSKADINDYMKTKRVDKQTIQRDEKN